MIGAIESISLNRAAAIKYCGKGGEGLILVMRSSPARVSLAESFLSPDVRPFQIKLFKRNESNGPPLLVTILFTNEVVCKPNVATPGGLRTRRACSASADQRTAEI